MEVLWPMRLPATAKKPVIGARPRKAKKHHHPAGSGFMYIFSATPTMVTPEAVSWAVP